MIELRLSSSGVAMTAEAVAVALLELEEPASVTSTWSVVRVSPAGPCALEPGVHALLPDCPRDRFVATVWPALKERFGLACGWMDASTPGFRGCTENYCSASVCPHRSQG
jgi:hypothetical protein